MPTLQIFQGITFLFFFFTILLLFSFISALTRKGNRKKKIAFLLLLVFWSLGFASSYTYSRELKDNKLEGICKIKGYTHLRGEESFTSDITKIKCGKGDGERSFLIDYNYEIYGWTRNEEIREKILFCEKKGLIYSYTLKTEEEGSSLGYTEENICEKK